MLVIPVINCGQSDKECLRRRLSVIKELRSPWVEIDIADGVFAANQTWGQPADFEQSDLPPAIALHLMVGRPMDYLRAWKGRFKRAVIHIESNFDLEELIPLSQDQDFEIMWGLRPETGIERVEPFLNLGLAKRMVQLLSVPPGPSGQPMNPGTLTKIRVLKQTHPDVIIEIDGGVNLETAKLVKGAGADIIVSSSFIFNSSDPVSRYQQLNAV